MAITLTKKMYPVDPQGPRLSLKEAKLENAWPIYLAQRLLTPQTRKHPRLIGSILGFCRLFNSKY